jgi:hypothetical protein
MNNIIAYNSTIYAGGGILCFYAPAIIRNNVIVNNEAAIFGGGLYVIETNPEVTNCVFWDNTPTQIYLYFCTPEITYNNIQGSWSGLGNINIDPLFRDPANGDYHLMTSICDDPYDSPCIDMGDPTIEDYLMDCNWGLGEYRSDMGAYSGGDSTIVGNYEPERPERISFLENHPNPFNASTILKYSLPEPSEVTIAIYDITGRKVDDINIGVQAAGDHAIIWDADKFTSGVYFAKLKTGYETTTRKMLLLK